MRALRATRQVSEPNRTDFLQLLGVAPDVDKPLLPHVTAGQRELHARIKFTVRRNVTSGVTGAAGQRIHVVPGGRGRRRAELVRVADESFVPEKAAKSRLSRV